MKAKFGGKCPLCERACQVGQQISRVAGDGNRWGHPECVSAAEKTRAILDWRTFRGHKPSGWRLGRGPGSSRER
ncbi:hypothetical protein GCM10027610_066780 [Dactylosporangium cerinum]